MLSVGFGAQGRGFGILGFGFVAEDSAVSQAEVRAMRGYKGIVLSTRVWGPNPKPKTL